MGTRKREALLVFSVNRYQLLGAPVARRTENFYECIIALFRPHRSRILILNLRMISKTRLPSVQEELLAGNG